jgi:hypothetical protein
MRHRLEKLIEGGDVYELETVDHGVVVGYDGDRPGPSSGDRDVRTHPRRESLGARLRRDTSDTTVKKQIEKPNSEH